MKTKTRTPEQWASSIRRELVGGGNGQTNLRVQAVRKVIAAALEENDAYWRAIDPYDVECLSCGARVGERCRGTYEYRPLGEVCMARHRAVRGT